MLNQDSNWKMIYERFSESIRSDLDYLCSFLVENWQEQLSVTLNETSNPERVIVALTQYLKNSSFSEEIIKKLVHDKKYMRFFERIFSQSPFLTEVVLKTPDYVDEILNDSCLSRPLTKEEWLKKLDWDISILDGKATELLKYLEHKQWISKRGRDYDFKGLMMELRKTHKKGLLRIATRDIVFHVDVKSVTEDLSNLADAYLELGIKLLGAILEPKYGTPRTLEETGKQGVPCRFVVLGLGKLGGRELNFSSDIDLLFIYDEDGETTGGWTGSVTNREYFSRLGELLIKLLSEHTEEGIIYRVDMRLRPYGRVGTLAESISNAVEYYFQYGRAWERQALVKCRPCAGDLDLGEEFIRTMRPFVFPKFFDDKTLEDIHHTKLLVEKQVAEQGQTEYEVKLGRGGIRDIEFTVQLLQLLNGGRQPDLRITNTIEVIYKLMEYGYIKPFDAETLINNYCFLREVEHRLQIEYGTQKHALPTDAKELAEFSHRFGYSSAESFLRVYRDKTREVRDILEQFVAVKASGNLWVYDLISRQTDGKEAEKKLQDYGFMKVDEARKIFQNLANGPEESPYPLHVRENFREVIPYLCEEFKNLDSPDNALSLFYKQVERVPSPGVIYSLLKENHKLCSFFVTLTHRAPALSEIWIKEPGIIEIFLQEELIGKKVDEEYLRYSLAELKKSVFPESAYYRLKDMEWLRIALGDLLHKFNIEDVCTQLTLLAEVILQEITNEVLKDTEEKYGECSIPFAILGLGKIGGCEMTFGSDLDLIFIYDDAHINGCSEINISVSEYFAEVATKIIRRLKEPTRFGVLYDIDARLRPYGSKGVLALGLTQLKEYYAEQADIWEKMALMKARVVSGKGAFLSEVQNMIRQSAFCFALTGEDIQRSENIRQKMVQQADENNLKKSEGGTAELEYIVRWWQRMNVEQCPRLATPSIVEALNTLVEILPERAQQWMFLKETFGLYLKILNRYRLYTGVRSSTLEELIINMLPQLLPEVDFSPSPMENLKGLKATVHQYYIDTIEQVKQWVKSKI